MCSSAAFERSEVSLGNDVKNCDRGSLEPLHPYTTDASQKSCTCLILAILAHFNVAQTNSNVSAIRLLAFCITVPAQVF